ncbi:Phospholipase/Carboxylesterase [Carpediemonas membranifera]|uniref:Phospholipase/Carboxylesterase n=1 Tax=Carpediemonas membranifera TaxID=201153 RepID=A0A8J6DZ69_9EUKA|nr:Phospholipase/Carboxylesterase [Carpediemonas membranifera]|eukprot:KAG9390026.1 Phospholipase/Carboxylesterase [Carpediemonas membranifera]
MDVVTFGSDISFLDEPGIVPRQEELAKLYREHISGTSDKLESIYLPPQNGESPKILLALFHGYSGSVLSFWNNAIDFAEKLPEAGIIIMNGAEAFEDNPEFPAEGRPDSRQWFSFLPSFSLPEAHERLASVVPKVHEYLDSKLQQFGLGPEKLALCGFSQGCMMATFTALTRRYGACVGVSGGVALDIRGPRIAKDIPHFDPVGFMARWASDTLPTVVATDSKYTPVMLMHGGQDPIVNPAVLPKSVKALACLGVAVESRVFADEGHHFNIDMKTAAADFIRRTFKI